MKVYCKECLKKSECDMVYLLISASFPCSISFDNFTCKSSELITSSNESSDCSFPVLLKTEECCIFLLHCLQTIDTRKKKRISKSLLIIIILKIWDETSLYVSEKYIKKWTVLQKQKQGYFFFNTAIYIDNDYFYSKLNLKCSILKWYWSCLEFFPLMMTCFFFKSQVLFMQIFFC